MKIVNIEEENVQIFQTNRGISIKFSEKNLNYDNIHKKISHKKSGIH